MVVNLLRCGKPGWHAAQRDLALGVRQRGARHRPLIMSQSQGGHASDDDPRVGMWVIKQAPSFLARGDASTGLLQHFGDGAVVVEGGKVSLKPRRER